MDVVDLNTVFFCVAFSRKCILLILFWEGDGRAGDTKCIQCYNGFIIYQIKFNTMSKISIIKYTHLGGHKKRFENNRFFRMFNRKRCLCTWMLVCVCVSVSVSVCVRKFGVFDLLHLTFNSYANQIYWCVFRFVCLFVWLVAADKNIQFWVAIFPKRCIRGKTLENERNK